MKDILLIVFFLLNTTCFSQVIVTSFEYNPLKLSNNIKSINYKVYDIEQKYGKNEDSIREDVLIERYYDLNNNLIKETHINKEDKETGLIRKEFLFTYQSKILQECTRTSYRTPNKYGFGKKVIILKYDSISNIIQEDNYDDNGQLTLITKFKYDSNNNLIEELYFNEKGLSQYSTKYKYDSNNKRVEMMVIDNYDSNNNETSLDSIYYDSNNNVIKVNSEFGKFKREHGIYRFKYDSNNNLIETTRELYSIYDRTTYKYDFNNNLIEMLEYSVDESFGEKKEILERKTYFNIKYRE